MPTKEDFIERYADLADMQLLEAYQNKADYGPDAVQAMVHVLKERGMWEDISEGNIASLLSKEEEEAKIADQAWIEDRSKRVFGDLISPDSNGVYADELILSSTRQHLGKNGRFKLYDHNGKLTIHIQHGDLSLEYSEPFNCEYYAVKARKRVNFIKVSEWYTLYILFKTKQGGITIHREQKIWKGLPDGFTWIDYDSPVLETEYQFEYFGSDVYLTDLQKFIESRG